MKPGLSRTAPFLACIVLCQTLTFFRAAGQDDDLQRDIQAKEVLKNRRKGKNPTANARYYYQSKPSSSDLQPGTFPIGPLPKNRSYMTLGVTLWKVRPSTEAESKNVKLSKERMEWDQEEHEVIVTRMSDESPVPNEELLQITIEYLPDWSGMGQRHSNRAAYLYVINREQFPNGTRNARLIFPTLLTYDGDNRLLPGKTITLPDPNRPFRIKRDLSAPAQTYETYTIILSPVPLDPQLPRPISRRAMELPLALVSRWERAMGITQVRADLREGLGQVRTQRELIASGNPSESRGTQDSAEDLTQDDLPPQSVYRKVAKNGDAMLVIVRIPFSESSAKP